MIKLAYWLSRRIGFHYGYVICVTGVVVVLASLGFSRFGYTMILPSMKEGLTLTYTQMGLLGTGNFVGYLIFALIGGILASKFGARRIVAISMSLVSGSVLLTGFSQSFLFALVMRTLSGIGAGGSNVPVMAMPSAWFSSKRRGLATGIMVGGSGFGLVITGFWIPQVLSSHGTDGWRFSWYYLGAIALLLTTASWLLLRDRPEEIGLTAVDANKGGPTNDRQQSHSNTGALAWRLVFGNVAVWHLGFVYVMFGFSYVIFVTFFAAYLVNEVGLSSAVAGQMWAMVGLFSTVSGIAWGYISDKLGRKYGLALVYSVQALSFYLFATAKVEILLYASAVLFGMCAWSIPGIMAATSGDYVGPRLAPAALGFITVLFGIGQALGPAVAGYIADSFGSFAWAYLAAAAAALLGLSGSLLLRTPHRQF